MSKLIKFSKSYKSLFNIKKDFYKNNQLNLTKAITINEYYAKQTVRKKCKNCNKKKSKYSFKSFQVNYFICKYCSHLNGKYQDSDQFNNYLYNKNKGKKYAKNYSLNYESRVNTIYIPKINFLQKVIGKNFSLVDIGSGAGHFLKACEKKKIKANGYETNATMVALAKKKLKKNLIFKSSLQKIYDEIINTSAKCISLIGVLEHLEDPAKVFINFKKSRAKFIFFSVPLFSFSTLLENSLDDVFPRQLSGAHTHLYTKRSIAYLIKKYNFKVKGEWWFGTDMADLFRSLVIKSKFKNDSEKKQVFKNLLYNHIDELQKVLDENRVCSEVHMVLSKK